MTAEVVNSALIERVHTTTRETPGHRSLADLLGRAAMDLGTQADLDATMGAVARNAAEITGGVASSAALFSSRRCSLNVSAATTDRAREADRCQLESGDGPSYAAMRQAAVITVPDTAKEERWRRWASASYELGLRSLVAVPLDLSPYQWAVVSVYWDRPDQPCPENVSAATLFALHAAVAITNARRSSTLREAIQARHQIGLAQGILMERLGLDARQSFAVLRRHSMDNNVKLNRIAKDIVETGRVGAVDERGG